MGGQTELYLKLLTLFRDRDGPRFMTDFRTACIDSDWQTARRLAHTLHGVAGTLGAHQLSAIAARLELATRGQKWASVVWPLSEIGPELERVLAGIAGVLDAQAGFARDA
jgi:two-component system, sensor histidine kinase and response regulator